MSADAEPSEHSIEPAEDVEDTVTGLGAALAITATRAIVIRERAEFRPRSGVRAWPYGGLSDVQLVQPRNGNGRVILRTGPEAWQAVSLFVGDAEWPAAERVVGKIRRRILRARRNGAGDEPFARNARARPPDRA
jgi:hypothetical protein